MKVRAFTPPPVEAFQQFDKPGVCNLLGFSERTLENLVKAGGFPPPVRIGRKVYWTEAAVRRWQQRQFNMQEAWVQK